MCRLICAFVVCKWHKQGFSWPRSQFSPTWAIGFSRIIYMYVTSTKQKPYEPRHDKTNKLSVRPAKTQISLGIRPIWSESSLCAQWLAKDSSFPHADSEDSDQTGRMPRLTCVFAGLTAILLVLSRLICDKRVSKGSPFRFKYEIKFYSFDSSWGHC